jgi:opacity protein-like surface antigen
VVLQFILEGGWGMKKIGSKVGLALAMVAGFGITTADAQMYLSGNLGAVMVRDGDVSVEGFTIGETSLDTGLGVTGGIGHAYGNGFRTEIELGYRTNDFDEIKGTGFFAGERASLNGDVSAFSLMVNGYYDLATTGRITPFVGGGLGFARVALDNSDFFGIDDNDTVFAYQLAIGGSINLNPQLNLDLQYRFLGTSDPEFRDDEGFKWKTEYTTHNLMVGLRYSF